MSGKGNIRFSELFLDTLNTHGLAFCREYYVEKHGMAEWEFSFWAFSVTRDLSKIEII